MYNMHGSLFMISLNLINRGRKHIISSVYNQDWLKKEKTPNFVSWHTFLQEDVLERRYFPDPSAIIGAVFHVSSYFERTVPWFYATQQRKTLPKTELVSQIA